MHTVEDHFRKTDAGVRAIYDALLQVSRGFGEFMEDPKKTSIHLNRRSAFAGIATRKSYLILTVKSSTELDHPRVSRMEQTSTSRWYSEIRLDRPEAVDAEIVRVLRDSYELSG